ncbi:MAG TPA: M28 family peptidase [Gemmatimonadaceae bacterium]
MHSTTLLARGLAPAVILALGACRTAAPADAGATIPPAASAGATEPSITAEDMRRRIFAFAHDSMLGREAGTLGNVKATDYVAAEFRRLGLEPAGENGTYFQTVPMVERRLLSSRVIADGETLAAGSDYVPLPHASFLPFGGGGRLDGVPVVYGGRLGEGAELADEESVAGKLVIVAPATGPNDRAMYNFWAHGAALRRFAGAAGVAVVSLEVTPPGVRSFFTSPQTIVADPDEAPRTRVGLVVSRRAAERLLGTSLDAARPGQAGRTATAVVEFGDEPLPHPARNVVAILRGADPAVNGQYVAIGAHNDHEGISPRAVEHDSLRAFNSVMAPLGANSPGGTPTPAQWALIRARLDSMRAIRPPRRDSIYNGADDDGSGTVTMLEAAEALAAGDPPRRSILFVSHTAEEKGLYGSFWFTDHPTVPRDSIVAQLNMDMVGRGAAHDIEGGGPNYLQIIGSRRLSTELGDLIDATNADLPSPFVIDYSFDARGHPLNRYCRSDHYSYARYGIPIAYFSRGYHIDYHELSDEPQYIDYAGMAKVGRLIADVAANLANRGERIAVDGPVLGPDQPCRQ